MRKHLTIAAVAGALALWTAPAAAQQPCGGSYTVRTGDTLDEIAARCATTIPALLATNPSVRDDRDLTVGGQIRIPAPGTRPTPVEACGGFYTLRPADTLLGVAVKCGLTVPLILAANPALEDPDNLRAGGKVRIPDLPRTDRGFRPVIVGGTPAAVVATDTVAVVAPDSVPAEAADSAPEPEPYLRYEGVLRAGARCIILRTSDGTEVGLTGELGPGFDPGDRVAVTGPAAPDADCGTARAVQVRIMWIPR